MPMGEGKSPPLAPIAAVDMGTLMGWHLPSMKGTPDLTPCKWYMLSRKK